MRKLFSFKNDKGESVTIDGSSSYEYDSDGIGHDRIKNGYKGEKKLCKFAKEFLQQLIDLTKNDNVDCTWSADKRCKEYDFGVIIEQMKQLNMVSSNDVKHFTMKASNYYGTPEREFDCYSLFNQRIYFQQDYNNLQIVAKSKRYMSQ